MDVFWSIVTRTGQTAVEATSTLLVGFIVAAVMRRMLGAEGTRKLFGGKGFKGLFRAWFIGSLLPVCSFGVIPVAREMKRAGVPTATILAFVLAAPQLNPLSFLYGLTLSEPIVIICFVIATMVIAILGGEIWKRLFEKPEDNTPPVDEETPAPGLKRLASVVVTAAKETVGPSMGYVLIGVLFTGLLAGIIPQGSLGMTMRHDDLSSPALMTVIGLPMYSGVLPGMMRIGLIFEHGNSTGAGFVLFELGVGFNLGLIVWLAVQFAGPRSFLWAGIGFFVGLIVFLTWQAGVNAFILGSAILVGIGLMFGLAWLFDIHRIVFWLGSVVLLVTGGAYVMENPLYFAKEEASHTHAFDDWTSPFPSGMGSPEIVGEKILEKVEVLEPVAIVLLAFLGLVGVGITLADRKQGLEKWLTTRPPESDAPKSLLNRGVPGPVLGVLALLGLVVFSVVALFIYYPNTKQAFTEILQTRTEAIYAVRTGNKEEAIRRIQHWDLLTRKLQVGVFLRTGRMDAEASKATEELREELEELRDALLADDLAKAKEMLPKIETTYRTFRSHYPH